MATIGAKAKRRAEAQARLSDISTRLGERLNIAFPDASRPVRDPELAAIVELERQGDVLEAIEQALDSLPESATTDDDDVVEMKFDRDALKEMKLDDLKALAIESGADEEAIKKMRSKDDVIDAMDALLASGDLTIGNAEDGDETDDEEAE